MKSIGKEVETRKRRLLLGTGLALAVSFFMACGLTPGGTEKGFLDAGKKALARNDYARAVIQFRNAVRIAPKDAEAFYQLGLAYSASRDLGSAYASFKKATELNPKHAEAQLKLAAIMLETSRKEMAEDAENRVRNVLGSTPPTSEALSLLAFSELRLGREQDAVRYLQQAVSQFPADLGSAALLMRIKLNQGDTKGAEEILKNCVAKAPRSPEAVLALGRFYLVTKKPDQAERQFQRALEIYPKYGPALKDLGMLQIQQSRYKQAEQTFKQLSVSPDKNYQPLYGLFLFEFGQRDAALHELERLAAADATDREARTRLVTAYLKAGRGADAENRLNNALEKNPKDTDALVQRAALRIRMGNYAEAQNDLNQAVHFRPDMAQAHLNLAALYEMRGEPSRARQELAETLRLNRAILPARLHLARMLIAANAAGPALEVLGQAFDFQQRSLEFIVQRNWALLALGRKEELRKQVDLGLTAARVPDLLAQDAFLKTEEGKYAAARSSLDEALKQDPENLPALEMLVRVYTIQKDLPGAIERIRAYAAQRPKSAQLPGILGNLLVAAGKTDEARNAYLQAKLADPKSTSVVLALANLDISKGKLDSARQELAPLRTTDPGNPRVWVYQGILEVAQKDYPRAVDNFRKGLDLDPKNVTALNNLAYLLATQPTHLDEALKYAQQAKEIAPDRSDVDDTIGWVLYNRGVYPSALTYLESAVKKNNNPAIRYHLAMAYAKVGDKRAPQMLREALKAAPDLPEAEIANQILAQTAHR